jgi:rod shape-determining protein MreD
MEQRFPFALLILAPLMAVFIQAYLPLRFPKLAILDLPLIVTIYFALARRSPMYGAFLGTGTGILQDSLTHLPLGINGICKAIVGYLAASVSTRLDVDNQAARLLIVLVLTMVHSLLHLVIVRLMLNLHPGWHWGYEFLRAALNTLVSLIFFRLLDLFRQQN